jgi:hypothetical protein
MATHLQRGIALFIAIPVGAVLGMIISGVGFLGVFSGLGALGLISDPHGDAGYYALAVLAGGLVGAIAGPLAVGSYFERRRRRLYERG